MEQADLMEALHDAKTVQFITDNFQNVKLVGFGTFSVVFKAESKQFSQKTQTFALKVILTVDGLLESDIKRIHEQEM